MVINYSLSQNSESLKLATEPPENPARAEKRGANLPKPVQKVLLGKAALQGQTGKSGWGWGWGWGGGGAGVGVGR